jgi:AraC family transcriptional regulator, regulatory protein of adaptative response / DNA-3-methyladenine glycosylase II
VILRAREPFDGAALLAFLARRAVPGVEAVVDGRYRRSLRLAHGGGTVELSPVAGGIRARLRVDARDRDEALARLAALLDLDAPVPEIAAVLAGDPVLAPYRPGLRVPGAVDGSEIAVRAVLGQQVSLAAAATHAARLVAAVGEPLAEPLGAVTHLFPTPEAIVGAPDAALAMPRARRRTLRSLAGVPLDELESLPGVGPWTQSYVAMRALRDRDAFLPSDLGVRHALAGAGDPRALAERWHPFRAYAVVQLWTGRAPTGGLGAPRAPA